MLGSPVLTGLDSWNQSLNKACETAKESQC